jgi:NAD(P) transhydrogenase subunit beta
MRELLYLVASVLFILGLIRLGSPKTARAGNTLAALGMLVAIVVTLVDNGLGNWGIIGGGVVLGSVIGAVAARRVEMTAMPQMVAVFNGFGGAASALVAAAEWVRADGSGFNAETAVTIALSTVIGAVTFSGSFVAFGKLQGIITGRPVTYSGQQLMSAALLVAALGVAIWAMTAEHTGAYWLLAALSLLIGLQMALPIGGADMPVVISLLNSFSGLAAAAAGFVIQNNALIIGGALVGSAGLILTNLMTKAMNRSLANVLFSGFGTADGAPGAGGGTSDRPVRSATADDVAIALGYARKVVIVPGYGLAVAQAQHAVHKLARELESRGVEVSYAIHPVAGRMPGHMNVLLAEADVPYGQLLDLEQSNPLFGYTDAVLIVGANDVVNPTARDDASSPIYGMPILNVDEAGTVIVVKRSLSPGFAGIDNPLFYDDKTMMFFADAKAALEDALAAMAHV